MRRLPTPPLVRSDPRSSDRTVRSQLRRRHLAWSSARRSKARIRRNALASQRTGASSWFNMRTSASGQSANPPRLRPLRQSQPPPRHKARRRAPLHHCRPPLRWCWPTSRRGIGVRGLLCLVGAVWAQVCHLRRVRRRASQILCASLPSTSRETKNAQASSSAANLRSRAASRFGPKGTRHHPRHLRRPHPQRRPQRRRLLHPRRRHYLVRGRNRSGLVSCRMVSLCANSARTTPTAVLVAPAKGGHRHRRRQRPPRPPLRRETAKIGAQTVASRGKRSARGLDVLGASLVARGGSGATSSFLQCLYRQILQACFPPVDMRSDTISHGVFSVLSDRSATCYKSMVAAMLAMMSSGRTTRHGQRST